MLILKITLITRFHVVKKTFVILSGFDVGSDNGKITALVEKCELEN